MELLDDPTDSVLRAVLGQQGNWAIRYHEHQSLLVDKQEEKITERQKEEADKEEADMQDVYEQQVPRGPVVMAPTMASSMAPSVQHVTHVI